MPDTSGRLRAARELRGFIRRAGRTATSPGIGRAALEALRGVLPYDCAALARWDPLTGRHATVAAVGYPPDALRFMDHRMHADPLYAQVRRDRGPLRVRDIPRPRRRGPVFDAVIDPLGFADGLTQCLFARDGRYLGMLNASTLTRGHPDDDAVTMLELLADDLGDMLDPIPAASPPTRALAGGDAEGLLVTCAGVTALSANACPDLTATGSPLRPVLDAALAGRQPPRRLLVLTGTRLFTVTLDGDTHGVVVLHRPAAAPFGLTLRELEVLDAVSRGRTNAEIARALHITPRTVATHIEHVLTKTGAPNRVAVTRLATQLGLLI
ncbi:LuxR C-terminal-related transcriptional regulator [Microtetraspora fusca]|uniref:LuxR C-terminal-related transcriptional regulator n=1 Tax=Microtetraspora fusca TaxID=1997 RepID=A0ABW6VE68_MICFU|nr:LuxR C-terminal-related transcriptional regulator [Microtetraspora fusca]